MLGFNGLQLPEWLRQFEARFGLGGVILFDYDLSTQCHGRNVQSPEQVRQLCQSIARMKSKPLVFVDQEGGHVRRLKEETGFAPLPAAKEFSALPLAQKEELARTSFQEMRGLGIHYNLAPVADLEVNPESPDIGSLGRAFSGKPEQVRENVRLLNRIAGEVGLGLCLKHYPGLGSATINTHRNLTPLPHLQPEETALFHELGAEINGSAVLVSHGIVDRWEPGVPVSISSVAIGHLREHLPDVLLISDDFQMEGLRDYAGTGHACEKGLAAGLDLLLIGNNLINEERRAKRIAERLSQKLIDEPALAQKARQAYARIQSRKQRFAV